MCGITGLINWGCVNDLSQMVTTQLHRGPDDNGIWQNNHVRDYQVCLASQRLAILDLSPAGHMPMSTADQRFTIVYNGEIYNYIQLRHQLEGKNYSFRSNSDTEVVLYLYQEYGSDAVTKLNGMFALAIWDNQTQQLFIARDHFGIKPLYYCHWQEKFAFASEIKTLLHLPDLSQKLNIKALHQYLSFLWVPDPMTMFQDIYKLPAGHWAIFKNNQLDIVQYWDPPMPDTQHLFQCDEGAIANELRTRFIQTVKSQMISDVPLGAFLSAGLDSSSIVAAMAHENSQPIRTFTIAFPDSYRRGELTLDDTDVARRTAQHFSSQHTEIMVEPDVVDLLPKLIWHMDEPTADPAIITAYLVNREARKDVTVLLSGVGGDELFAGYRKYQAHYLAEHYRRLPQVLRQKLIEPGIKALPAFRNTPFKGYARLAKKMARSGSLPPHERFIMDSIYLSEGQKQALYTDELAAQLTDIDPRQRHLDHLDRVAHADFLNQMLYLDIKTFMVSLNLNYNDKMSMASSVEVRVPFLDWELAEWVAMNIPPGLKLQKGVTKHILREAMRPLLPTEVLQQKKAGFGAPIDYWLANDLQEMTDDLLNPTAISKRGLFKPEFVQKLMYQQRSGQEDWSMQIWQLLTLELWMQTFNVQI